MLHVIFTRENITIVLAGYMINQAFLPQKKLLVKWFGVSMSHEILLKDLKGLVE